MRTITHWIGGKPATGSSDRTSAVFNPATGEQRRTIAVSRPGYTGGTVGLTPIGTNIAAEYDGVVHMLRGSN